MKKLFMMIALMAIPFAMQAQTKFHDVEANEATGAVKCIKSSMMGREQVINFTKEGKMQSDGISDAKYDENGYLQSIVTQIGGKRTITHTTFIWENGRVKTQIATRKNKKVITNNVYDDRGILVRQIIETDGHEVTYDFYDIQLDDHGNWTSRKTKVAGIEIIYPRTIQYY